MKPRVFLFDEPFGALDEITRERLNDELLRLFQIEGFAGLFISYSPTYREFFLGIRDQREREQAKQPDDVLHKMQ